MSYLEALIVLHIFVHCAQTLDEMTAAGIRIGTRYVFAVSIEITIPRNHRSMSIFDVPNEKERRIPGEDTTTASG